MSSVHEGVVVVVAVVAVVAVLLVVVVDVGSLGRVTVVLVKLVVLLVVVVDDLLFADLVLLLFSVFAVLPSSGRSLRASSVSWMDLTGSRGRSKASREAAVKFVATL